MAFTMRYEQHYERCGMFLRTVDETIQPEPAEDPDFSTNKAAGKEKKRAQLILTPVGAVGAVGAVSVASADPILTTYHHQSDAQDHGVHTDGHDHNNRQTGWQRSIPTVMIFIPVDNCDWCVQILLQEQREERKRDEARGQQIARLAKYEYYNIEGLKVIT